MRFQLLITFHILGYYESSFFYLVNMQRMEYFFKLLYYHYYSHQYNGITQLQLYESCCDLKDPKEIKTILCSSIFKVVTLRKTILSFIKMNIFIYYFLGTYPENLFKQY